MTAPLTHQEDGSRSGARAFCWVSACMVAALMAGYLVVGMFA